MHTCQDDDGRVCVYVLGVGIHGGCENYHNIIPLLK